MLEEKSSIKIMKRSAIREAAFKLIYSFEIQEPENLEEQIDLYLECEEITDKEAKEYIIDAINGIKQHTDEINNLIWKRKVENCKNLPKNIQVANLVFIKKK